MPTKDDLPDSDELLDYITKVRDIQLEPADQPPADFLKNVSKLPRSKRVEILFGPTLFDYQRKMLDVNAWNKHTKSASPIGRRGGKTFCGSLIAADAPLKPAQGEDTLITAPYQSTADEMMQAATAWYYESPWPDRFGMSVKEFFGIETDNKTMYEFDSGARIISQTTGDDGSQIRGLGPQIIIFDEAAFNKKESILTEVIEPMFGEFTGDVSHIDGFEDRPDTTEFYLYSTTNGKSGYFYRKCNDAREDNSDWFRFHWPTTINPMVADSFVEKKRESLDTLSFEKEYLAIFTDEGDVFIKHRDAKECVRRDMPTFAPSGIACFGGIDPARGGKDETAGVLVDEKGTVNVYQVMPENDTKEIVGMAKAMNRDFGPEEIYIESNVIGGGAVDFAAEYGVHNIGEIKSTLKTKSEYYNLLKRRIDEGSLTLPDHTKLIEQLTDLEFTHTPSGYVKVHHRDEKRGDDIPDALAIACYAAGGNAPTSRPKRPDSTAPVIG